MSIAKTFVCSDESVNSYGFRVLTNGIKLKNFKANPVMLFNHLTGDGWLMNDPNYKGPVGRWENPRLEDNQLKADAVFDTNDATGKVLSDKVENNFIRAASIGFRILKTSNDAKDMVAGQTRPTVTECELVEISVVDLPANKNALALFDNDGKRIELKDENINACLSAGLSIEIPKPNTMKLKIMTAWTALMAALKLTAVEGKDHVETETSSEALSELNDSLTQLGTIQAELDTLKADKGKLTTDLSAANDKLKKAQDDLAAANLKIAELKGEGTDTEEAKGGNSDTTAGATKKSERLKTDTDKEIELSVKVDEFSFAGSTLDETEKK